MTRHLPPHILHALSLRPGCALGGTPGPLPFDPNSFEHPAQYSMAQSMLGSGAPSAMVQGITGFAPDLNTGALKYSRPAYADGGALVDDYGRETPLPAAPAPQSPSWLPSADWKDGDPLPAPPQAQQAPMSVPQAIGTVAKGAYSTAKDALSLPGDVYAGRVDPLSNQGMDRAANLAMMLPAAGMPMAEDGALGAGGGRIIAYHGSPHSFDKFSLDKIGTGEGAQAYGHGLYFAENEGVAKGYRDALADETLRTPDGSVFDPSSLEHMNVRVAARRNGPDLDATIERAKSLLPGTEQSGPMLQRDIARLQALKDQGGVTKNPGSMYQVAINADPEHFLDWDKPLSEQPPKAQDAILSARYRDNPEAIAAAKADPDYMGRSMQSMMYDLSHPSILGGADKVSAKLRDAGIPGIKYKDAGSRGADGSGGTSNYVSFNDHNIEILRKYGLAGLMAGGAGAAGVAAQSQGQDQPQGFAKGGAVLHPHVARALQVLRALHRPHFDDGGGAGGDGGSSGGSDNGGNGSSASSGADSGNGGYGGIGGGGLGSGGFGMGANGTSESGSSGGIGGAVGGSNSSDAGGYGGYGGGSVSTGPANADTANSGLASSGTGGFSNYGGSLSSMTAGTTMGNSLGAAAAASSGGFSAPSGSDAGGGFGDTSGFSKSTSDAGPSVGSMPGSYGAPSSNSFSGSIGTQNDGYSSPNPGYGGYGSMTAFGAGPDASGFSAPSAPSAYGDLSGTSTSAQAFGAFGANGVGQGFASNPDGLGQGGYDDSGMGPVSATEMADSNVPNGPDVASGQGLTSDQVASLSDQADQNYNPDMPAFGPMPPARPSNDMLGFDPSYFGKMHGIEAGVNPDGSYVTNAYGYFGPAQFGQSTWGDVVKGHPDLGLPANMHDATPDQYSAAEQAFTNDNVNALNKAGLPVNNVTAYMAHQMGLAGAETALRAGEDASLADAGISPAMAKANPAIYAGAHTVGDVEANIAARMSSSAPAAPSAPAATGDAAMSGLATNPSPPADIPNGSLPSLTAPAYGLSATGFASQDYSPATQNFSGYSPQDASDQNLSNFKAIANSDLAEAPAAPAVSQAAVNAAGIAAANDAVNGDPNAYTGPATGTLQNSANLSNPEDDGGTGPSMNVGEAVVSTINSQGFDAAASTFGPDVAKAAYDAMKAAQAPAAQAAAAPSTPAEQAASAPSAPTSAAPQDGPLATAETPATPVANAPAPAAPVAAAPAAPQDAPAAATAPKTLGVPNMVGTGIASVALGPLGGIANAGLDHFGYGLGSGINAALSHPGAPASAAGGTNGNSGIPQQQQGQAYNLPPGPPSQASASAAPAAPADPTQTPAYQAYLTAMANNAPRHHAAPVQAASQGYPALPPGPPTRALYNPMTDPVVMRALGIG